MDYRQILQRKIPGRGRVLKELRELWVDPPAFCRPGASPVTDLFRWEVVIDGPAGSPYEGGTFPLDVDLTDGYPERPPKIRFKTKVFHPNIDTEGAMVLDILQHDDEWRPAMRIDRVLHSVVSVLYDPLLDFPVDDDIAHLYKKDVKLYDDIAAAWTREYSSTPIVSHYPTEKELQHCEMVAARAALEMEAKAERLRRRKEKERERRRRRKEEEEENNESRLRWLWRRVLAFFFRDDGPPLPSDVPIRRTRTRREVLPPY